jgi:hypothetical protein
VAAARCNSSTELYFRLRRFQLGLHALFDLDDRWTS